MSRRAAASPPANEEPSQEPSGVASSPGEAEEFFRETNFVPDTIEEAAGDKPAAAELDPIPAGLV